MTRPLIVAMKGHPGSGKSTLARRIASSLRCPLLDKDDVRDPTLPLAALAPSALLNDLSYSVLLRLAETQLLSASLPALVLSSPLSSRALLDRLLALARRASASLLLVECRPLDGDAWRRRLEARGAAVAEGGRGWHKPRTWEDLTALLEAYGGRADYDVGNVPRLVVDTTGDGGIDRALEEVLEFVRSHSDGVPDRGL